MLVLHPSTPIEGLPDEVSVAGVPGGLLNQVQQHPAQVAVDDVRPCAGVVELHGVDDLPGRLCCLLVARHPLLDRVPVVDEEVPVRDRLSDKIAVLVSATQRCENRATYRCKSQPGRRCRRRPAWFAWTVPYTSRCQK